MKTYLQNCQDFPSLTNWTFHRTTAVPIQYLRGEKSLFDAAKLLAVSAQATLLGLEIILWSAEPKAIFCDQLNCSYQ